MPVHACLMQCNGEMTDDSHFTSNVKRFAMKSEASTDTVGLSAETQDSFQATTVELALVPTRVMWGLSTTTFSLQNHVGVELHWQRRVDKFINVLVEPYIYMNVRAEWPSFTRLACTPRA